MSINRNNLSHLIFEARTIVIFVAVVIVAFSTCAEAQMMLPKITGCKLLSTGQVAMEFESATAQQPVHWNFWQKNCGPFPRVLPKALTRCERHNLSGITQLIFQDGTQLRIAPDIDVEVCNDKLADTWTEDTSSNEPFSRINPKDLKKISLHNHPFYRSKKGKIQTNRIEVERANPSLIFQMPLDSSDRPNRDNPDAMTNTFVGIAISGGGTRAANFGLAVIQQLEELGIMSHVTAISSVSGGSLAAAYYGLYGLPKNMEQFLHNPQRVDFWRKAKSDLQVDIRTAWVKKYLLPQNIIRTTFTDKNRTDLLADVFDEKFYGGKTFDDLDKFGPFAPLLSINATTANELPEMLLPEIQNKDSVARGLNAPGMAFQSFSFNADSFDKLGSDLANFRISSAVAASAAFPGVFNDLTLASYTSSEIPKVRGYLHLFDGGPSDNLGTDALISLAQRWYTTYQSQRSTTLSPPNGCMLIIIDAYASRTGRASLGDERDPRRMYDYVVDFNFMDATDALLMRRREDTLAQMGVPLVRIGERVRWYETDTPSLPSMKIKETRRFNESVQLVLGEHKKSDLLFFEDGPKDYLRTMECAVWHISLDDIRSISMGKTIEEGQIVDLFLNQPSGKRGGNTREEDNNEFIRMLRRSPEESEKESLEIRNEHMRFRTLPEIRFRDSVWWVTSATATDFDLVGAPGCGKKTIQNALWDAARIAVYDDVETRINVCQWMRKHGLEPGSICSDLTNGPLKLPPYPVKLMQAGQTYKMVGCTQNELNKSPPRQ